MLNPIVTLIYIEAEFVALLSAAKSLKYILYILLYIESNSSWPPKLYCGNMSDIMIVNSKIPRSSTKHIYIYHFYFSNESKRYHLSCNIYVPVLLYLISPPSL